MTDINDRLSHIPFLFLAAFGLLGPGCREEQVALQVKFEAPPHFPALQYDLAQNPVTTEGFLLGRTLFYDGQLSRDNSISCGSCHQQSAGFTHHGHDLSHGIDDQLGNRNTPPVMNLAWHPTLFWDGGVHDLDLLPLAPIENPVEMDEDMANVLEKLRKDARYPPLFQQAFGTPEITTERTLKALAQFMLMCVSADTRYDRYLQGEATALNSLELEGKQVFEQKCGNCHQGALLSDFSFRNNGLGTRFNPDQGRYAITLQEEDRHKFKVPSLRNVIVTAPYMHDGRFYTLDEVFDHYDRGVQPSPTLDPALQADGRLGIALTPAERASIRAFLQALTDSAFIRNPLLSEQ